MQKQVGLVVYFWPVTLDPHQFCQAVLVTQQVAIDLVQPLVIYGCTQIRQEFLAAPVEIEQGRSKNLPA
jgi:hypothetical protein